MYLVTRDFEKDGEHYEAGDEYTGPEEYVEDLLANGDIIDDSTIEEMPDETPESAAHYEVSSADFPGSTHAGEAEPIETQPELEPIEVEKEPADEEPEDQPVEEPVPDEEEVVLTAVEMDDLPEGDEV